MQKMAIKNAPENSSNLGVLHNLTHIEPESTKARSVRGMLELVMRMMSDAVRG